jgi:hypothetical protein
MFKYRHDIQSKLLLNPINEEVENYRRLRYRELITYLINSRYVCLTDHAQLAAVDIGCGTGSGLLELKELGLRTIGIEPDESRAQYGITRGVEIHTVPWSQSHDKLKDSNIVFSIHSLEHLYDPTAFLSYVYHYVQEGTLFYLEVPNMAYIPDWTDALYLAHINNFSEQSLVKLSERCGFEILGIIAPSSIYSSQNDSICILLQKKLTSTRHSDPQCPRKFNSGNTARQLIAQYTPSEMSSIIKTEYPVFVIPFVNDLSLGYRHTKINYSSVQENQSGRALTYNHPCINIA